MKENNPLTHMRIAGAMIAGLLLVELAGFTLFGVYYSFYDMVLSLVVAFGLALVYSLAVWPVFKKINLKKETGARVTSLVASLAIIGLALVLWLHVRFLSSAPVVIEEFAVFLLAILLTVLGVIVWIYLSRGDPHLADIRFQALAPLTVIAVGAFSVAGHVLLFIHQRAIATFGIFIFFIGAYYVLVRMMWRRRRAFIERSSMLLHVMVIIAAILIASLGAGFTYYQKTRPAAAPSDSPPVILISIDTLRSDYLSCYNPDTSPTPNMDMLAGDGILFQHPVAPSSWTPPSVAAILTGLSPTACGAGILIPGNPHDHTGPLLASETIAEVLVKNGYHTSALVNNYEINESREFDQGFEHYEMLTSKKGTPIFIVALVLDYVLNAIKGDWKGHAEWQTARAIELLENRAPGPFFFWIHYLDPHQPYNKHNKHKNYKPNIKPGPMTKYMAMEKIPVNIRGEIFGLREKDKEYLRQRYEGEVRFTDDQVGKLFKWLKEKGLYRKSLIILTSDHGEEFWEHESFAHGHSFHKEVMEVPLIMKLPENESAGATVKEWVDLKRIGATMIDVLEIREDFPGESLRNELKSGHINSVSSTDRFWISEKVLYGLEKGTIVNSQGNKAIIHSDGTITCYDLSKDPKEQNPYAEGSCPWPENYQSPRKIFEEIRNNDQKKYKELGGGNPEKRKIPTEDLLKVRALGYF